MRLLKGKSVVELSVSHADKGSAIAALGREVGSDAIFYSGDDVTDEDAFRALDSEEGDVPVKVGGGTTHAAYRVESVADVVATLEQLRELQEQATGETSRAASAGAAGAGGPARRAPDGTVLRGSPGFRRSRRPGLDRGLPHREDTLADSRERRVGEGDSVESS